MTLRETTDEREMQVSTPPNAPLNGERLTLLVPFLRTLARLDIEEQSNQVIKEVLSNARKRANGKSGSRQG
jgi:hypothetical protein